MFWESLVLWCVCLFVWFVENVCVVSLVGNLDCDVMNFIIDDGLQFYIWYWFVTVMFFCGQLLFVYGLGEYCGCYEYVVVVLNVQGWEVYGWDYCGYGCSFGWCGDIFDVEVLLCDMVCVIDVVCCLGLFFVLLGYSMGGVVVGCFVVEVLIVCLVVWLWLLDVLVLFLFVLDLGLFGVQKLVFVLVERFVLGLVVGNGFKFEWISCDLVVVVVYVVDLLVYDCIIVWLMCFIVDVGVCVIVDVLCWMLLMLLMWVDVDCCVVFCGSEVFVVVVLVNVVVIWLWFGFFYEIFNEFEKDEVFGVFSVWLNC